MNPGGLLGFLLARLDELCDTSGTVVAMARMPAGASAAERAAVLDAINSARRLFERDKA